MNCTHCGSEEYWKCGFYETKQGKKQRYKCKECLRKFTPKSPFKGLEKPSEMISTAFDLYCKGLSLRNVAKFLWKQFKVKMSHTTIWYWIQKYAKKIKNSIKKSSPENIGGLWHADEMMLKLQGEEYWMWNMIDHQSRYLINYKISKDRKLPTIKDFLIEAKEAAGNKEPRLLITDGLQGYPSMFKKVFGSQTYPMSQHYRVPGLTEKRRNNNRVERFHGTIRDRLKTMRGYGRESAFQGTIELIIQHYNLVRNHSSFENKTPAQKVGLNLELNNNSWLELIQRAIQNNYTGFR